MGHKGAPRKSTTAEAQLEKARREKAAIDREATIGSFRPPRYDYRGARHGEPLVLWLNEPSIRAQNTKSKKTVKDVGRERVSALIDGINQFNRIASIQERQRDLSQAAINNLLKVYAEHPALFVNDKGDIVFEQEPADEVVVDGKIEAGPTQSERQAVAAVVVLNSKHLLDRVRRCQCCGRWLFQTRTGKRSEIFCNEACRKKYHPRREVA